MSDQFPVLADIGGDFVTRDELAQILANFLALDGGFMRGPIDMGGQRISEGTFSTASSGQRVEMAIGSQDRINFYTGNDAELNPANLQVDADQLFVIGPELTGSTVGPGVVLRSEESTGNEVRIHAGTHSGYERIRLQAVALFSGTGTQEAPSIAKDGDDDTGMYFPAADEIGFSTAGTDRVRIDADGAIAMSEMTTPTALADYGKIYTKSDNKMYFQDGAGVEHEVAFV